MSINFSIVLAFIMSLSSSCVFATELNVKPINEVQSITAVSIMQGAVHIYAGPVENRIHCRISFEILAKYGISPTEILTLAKQQDNNQRINCEGKNGEYYEAANPQFPRKFSMDATGMTIGWEKIR